jgi:hypothetical protein
MLMLRLLQLSLPQQRPLRQNDSYDGSSMCAQKKILLNARRSKSSDVASTEGWKIRRRFDRGFAGHQPLAPVCGWWSSPGASLCGALGRLSGVLRQRH